MAETRAKTTTKTTKRPVSSNSKKDESFERRFIFGRPTGLDEKEFTKILDAVAPFLQGSQQQIRKAARDHLHKLVIDSPSKEPSPIDKLLFALACVVSESALPGYATLDDAHSDDINKMTSLIETYIDDTSRRRPINFLMLASPGAGKSHFIDCVARRMNRRKVVANTFNMASMTTNEELIRPLDDARNAKVEDNIPLLFLDEFDSSPRNFALLLPLLWDGSLSLGQRDLKLNKSIIVMAGSSPSLPEALNHARSMRREIPLPDGTNPKLIDLFSRINGSVIRIPPFYDATTQIDRRSDKVAITVNLLRRRFGDSLKTAPLPLFQFVAQTTFRYDVRSIAHLIELIPFKRGVSDLSLDALGLPIDSPEAIRASSLAYHLVDDQNQAHGIADVWRRAKEHNYAVPLQLNFPFLMQGGEVPSEMLEFAIMQMLPLIDPEKYGK